MTVGCLQFSDILRLARQKKCLEGRIKFTDLSRLLELIDSTLEGQSDGFFYQLLFSETEEQRIKITGYVRTKLKVTCQRCLRLMPLSISHDIRLLAVETEEEEEQIFDSLEEPIAITQTGIWLSELLEDELILAIPFAPRHILSECDVKEPIKNTSLEREVKTDRWFPFRDLQKLLDK